VDKLDKIPWNEVRKEMIEQKGLAPEVADKIWSYVQLNGPANELLTRIINDKLLDENPLASTGVQELKILFEYLDCYSCLDKIRLDFSLARGLDYYTGVIYEAVLIGTPPSPPLPPSPIC
jgi:histidyl-tRNA synthetase